MIDAPAAEATAAMPTCLLPKSANPNTCAEYLNKGLAHAARALQNEKLDLEDPRALDAIVKDREACTIKLSRATVNLYRAHYRALLRNLVERTLVAPRCAEEAFRRIDAALLRQCENSEILPLRTSARKANDVTKERRRKVLRELARLSRKGDKTASLVGITVFLIGTFALRPREALYVRLGSEDALCFPILKIRRKVKIRLCRFPNITLRYNLEWRKGISAYISAIEKRARTLQDLGKLYNTFASKLARACKRVEVPRLCFSAFRHMAIAEFRAAGATPDALAKALGHETLRTQSRYGKGARNARPREIPPSEIVVYTSSAATDNRDPIEQPPRAPEPISAQENARPEPKSAPDAPLQAMQEPASPQDDPCATQTEPPKTASPPQPRQDAEGVQRPAEGGQRPPAARSGELPTPDRPIPTLANDRKAAVNRGLAGDRRRPPKARPTEPSPDHDARVSTRESGTIGPRAVPARVNSPAAAPENADAFSPMAYRMAPPSVDLFPRHLPIEIYSGHSFPPSLSADPAPRASDHELTSLAASSFPKPDAEDEIDDDQRPTFGM